MNIEKTMTSLKLQSASIKLKDIAEEFVLYI